MGLATTDTGTGIYGGGTSKTYGGIGVRGETSSGVGVQGQSFGSGLAGKFIGNVLVTGTLTANQDIVLAGADCAEQFDVADEQQLEPGTVVVIDEEGAVRESRAAYDKKVAGVVSGGGHTNLVSSWIDERRTETGQRWPWWARSTARLMRNMRPSKSAIF